MPKIFSQATFHSSLDLSMKGGEEKIWENNDDGDADVVKFVFKAERT